MTTPLLDKYKPTIESTDALEEIEYDFYVKMYDIKDLLKASKKIHQEQWVIKLNQGEFKTTTRCRKSVIGEDITYVMCVKVDMPGIDGDWELEKETTRLNFEHVKDYSTGGMIKDRYIFPIDGTDLLWEVDVFLDADGNIYPWVKIDLEVPDRTTEVPALPFEYTDSIFNQKGERTKEEEDFIHELYSETYLTFKE